jgi:hypothetical protein
MPFKANLYKNQSPSNLSLVTISPGDTLQLVLYGLYTTYQDAVVTFSCKVGSFRTDLTAVANSLPAFPSTSSLSITLPSSFTNSQYTIELVPTQTLALDLNTTYALELEFLLSTGEIESWQFVFKTGQDIVGNTTPATAGVNNRRNLGNFATAPVTAVQGDCYYNTTLSKYYERINGAWVEFGAGAGSTNLSYTASPTQGQVNSDTGNDAVIPATDVTNAGLFLPTEKTKLAGIDLTRNVVTTVHFPGYSGVGNSTLANIETLESDTKAENLGVLLFYQVTTTFSLARWNEIKAFLDVGRIVVVNIEPMGTLAQINAGNFDTAFTEFKNYAQDYALANPTFTKEKLLVKFMHEGNLSVGAYPWVVYDTPNLGVTYNKLTTPNSTVQTAINNFKTGFTRLADILGNTYLQRIFELGQDSWSGATQALDLFFPVSTKYEIVSVNSYNRYGVSSGYGYWSAFGDNLRAWLAATERVAPDKPKMIGECATTAGGVVNPLGTVATITSGGTGFPASTTATIPSSAIVHNGDIAPVLTYTTNSSGVITGVSLVEKGSDITAISVVPTFAGGSGANITINLKQTGVSKPDWILQAFRFIRNNTDFKYFGWFLENKNVSPTDNRDWGLNTTRSRQAFGEGWALLNDRVSIPSIGGKVLPNIFTDPYTATTTGWDASGSQVGTLSRTTLVTNLPVNDRNVTGAIRLTQPSGAVSNGIPYNNRLRYSVPYWNGSGSWNGGIQPNDIVTIEFDALFKPNNANTPNYKAPLIVAIEDTLTNNYERGSTPQVFLTKQMKRYKIITSNGQASTGGWFISFMIGNIEVQGEFIITNLNGYIGDQVTPLENYARLSGDTFTGDIFATNLSGTNTGDERPTMFNQPMLMKMGVSSGASAVAGANTVYYQLIEIDRSITAFGINVLQNTIISGNVQVALYQIATANKNNNTITLDGSTKLRESGSVVMTGNVGFPQAQLIPFTSTVAITAGLYFLAVQYSSATATFSRYGNFTVYPNLGYTSVPGSFTLPATAPAGTATNNNQPMLLLIGSTSY